MFTAKELVTLSCALDNRIEKVEGIISHDRSTRRDEYDDANILSCEKEIERCKELRMKLTEQLFELEKQG